jgi:glycosyltransferase involved in cell wall biosynthesis
VHVILDGSVIYQRQGAGYKYIAEMVPRLRARPDLTLELVPSPTGIFDFLLPGRPAADPGDRWLSGRVPRPWRRPVSWARRRLESARRRRRAKAIFHSYYYSSSPRRSWPQLQVVHDLITERFEADYRSPNERSFRRQKRRCLEAATRLVAVSQNTKRDLIDLLGVAPDRIDVVPQAVNAEFLAVPIPTRERAVGLERLGIHSPFLLQVGGRMKHKNFGRLLEAFAASKLATGVQLVCAGESFSDEERQAMRRLGLGGAVVLVRWPEETDLRLLYQAASGLVYPSIYEGFGIPPLEAMACGTPVAAARAASLPEVCGDAALFFDPLDPSAIAEAMLSLFDDKKVGAMRERGIRRAALFNWESTAQQTFAVYERVWS